MKYLIFIPFIAISTFSIAQNRSDAIVGKWMAIPKKNLIVEVFKSGNEYRGKILWFNDNDDKTKPMNTRLDEKNENPALRKRKILGLEVLDDMVYNAKSNKWENGKIYDAKSGKTWNCSASIIKDTTLQVRGFWRFEFIGMNMNFKKIV